MSEPGASKGEAGASSSASRSSAAGASEAPEGAPASGPARRLEGASLGWWLAAGAGARGRRGVDLALPPLSGRARAGARGAPWRSSSRAPRTSGRARGGSSTARASSAARASSRSGSARPAGRAASSRARTCSPTTRVPARARGAPRAPLRGRERPRHLPRGLDPLRHGPPPPGQARRARCASSSTPRRDAALLHELGLDGRQRRGLPLPRDLRSAPRQRSARRRPPHEARVRPPLGHPLARALGQPERRHDLGVVSTCATS